MRILKVLGIAALALLMVSCTDAAPDADESRALSASATAPASATPATTATAAPTPPTSPSDPRALVEREAATRCDGQGTASYPGGFTSHRTSASPSGSWDGAVYRLSYPATVTLPAVTPDTPPTQQLVLVDCALQEDGGEVIVASWTAT